MSSGEYKIPEHARLCGTARVYYLLYERVSAMTEHARRADGLELAFLEMGQGFSQNSSAFHHVWLYFSLLRCCLQRLHVHYSDRGTCRSILLARATKKRNVEQNTHLVIRTALAMTCPL